MKPSIPIKDGQPDGGLLVACPFHTMPPMGWDVDVIAWHQVDQITVPIKPQFGFAFQNNHPLVFVLIVPNAIRRDMPGGDDAFDSNLLTLREDIGQLLRS